MSYLAVEHEPGRWAVLDEDRRQLLVLPSEKRARRVADLMNENREYAARVNRCGYWRGTTIR